MTRFARARGSMSSNERLPEESTSWQVMRRQLLEAQQQQDTRHQHGERSKSPFTGDSENTEKQVWAEFEMKPTKSKAHRTRVKASVEAKEDISDVADVELKDKKQIKNKQTKEEILKGNVLLTVSHDKVKQKRTTLDLSDKNIESPDKNLNKSKRKKSKQSYNIPDLSPDREVWKINKAGDEVLHDTDTGGQDNFQTGYNQTSVGQHKNNKTYKRRKPEIGSQTMFINGQKIEIIKFDGFPVKKEDADRLKQLRQKLISKGLPQADISQTMKLERRKAEKALARERKKVCFHCRKPGHNLSDCPELDDGKNRDSQVTGICFKCGSTEHTHYECRVNRSEGFHFTKCFVCNEQGHIARQCPDNPRGLYPKGGSCRVCGDVTHMKKDCPDLVQEKKEQTITVKTLNKNNLEALDEDLTKQQLKPYKSKQKNIVKF